MRPHKTAAQSDDWPVEAIPKLWVEKLFSVMSATYGSHFADLWRGGNFEEVKKHWGVELAKLTSAQMKAGREALTDLKKAPNLAEFIAHCRSARSEAARSEFPQLEHVPASDPKQAAQNMDRLNREIRKMRPPQPSAEWAFKLILKGTTQSGLPLSYASKKRAMDVITSSAGYQVIADCVDPKTKAQYESIRKTFIDNYRERGEKIPEVL